MRKGEREEGREGGRESGPEGFPCSFEVCWCELAKLHALATVSDTVSADVEGSVLHTVSHSGWRAHSRWEMLTSTTGGGGETEWRCVRLKRRRDGANNGDGFGPKPNPVP